MILRIVVVCLLITYTNIHSASLPHAMDNTQALCDSCREYIHVLEDLKAVSVKSYLQGENQGGRLHPPVNLTYALFQVYTMMYLISLCLLFYWKEYNAYISICPFVVFLSTIYYCITMKKWMDENVDIMDDHIEATKDLCIPRAQSQLVYTIESLKWTSMLAHYLSSTSCIVVGATCSFILYCAIQYICSVMLLFC